MITFIRKLLSNPKTLRVLLALDELGNTIIPFLPWPFTWPGAGHNRETMSESLGELKLENNGTIPWKWPVAKLLDVALSLIDPGHSIDAIDDYDEDGTGTN